MSHIILNEDQAKILGQAQDPVEVRDPKGMLLGHLHLSEDAKLIALIKKRRAVPQPTIPAHQVKADLHALEEAAQQGASRKQLRDLSKRLLDEAKE